MPNDPVKELRGGEHVVSTDHTVVHNVPNLVLFLHDERLCFIIGEADT